MADNTETMAVEAIWLCSLKYSENLWFSKEAMKNMQRLRILYIWKIRFDSEEENDGSIDYLSNNLRWFVWWRYPWKLLPQNFNPIRLVYLDLSGCSLRYLWNETKQQLPSLRRLNLHWSKSLKTTPNFRGMPNLEYLNLRECESLEEVHRSLRCSRKLIGLNLYACKSLKRFPFVNVESLKFLDLGSCSSLEKLPKILGIMKPELKIKMSYSGIREIPSSIIHLQAHLTELYLRGMNNLVSLASSICKLKDLVKLNVSNCSKLESLLEEISDLENLEQLHVSGTLISRPPSSIVRLNKLKVLTFAKGKAEHGVYFVFPQVNEGLRLLEELNLSCCNLIDEGLPEDIGSLSSLKRLNLSRNHFEHLPRSVAQLCALQSLNLSRCNNLKELPGFTGMPNLEYLDLRECESLEEVHHSLRYSRKLIDLSLNKCKSLKKFPYVDVESLKSLNLKYCSSLEELPEILGIMKPELKINMKHYGIREIPSSRSSSYIARFQRHE